MSCFSTSPTVGMDVEGRAGSFLQGGGRVRGKGPHRGPSRTHYLVGGRPARQARDSSSTAAGIIDADANAREHQGARRRQAHRPLPRRESLTPADLGWPATAISSQVTEWPGSPVDQRAGSRAARALPARGVDIEFLEVSGADLEEAFPLP